MKLFIPCAPHTPRSICTTARADYARVHSPRLPGASPMPTASWRRRRRRKRGAPQASDSEREREMVEFWMILANVIETSTSFLLPRPGFNNVLWEYPENTGSSSHLSAMLPCLLLPVRHKFPGQSDVPPVPALFDRLRGISKPCSRVFNK